MTKEELLKQGIKERWIDELELSLYELCCATDDSYQLDELIYDRAFNKPSDEEHEPNEQYFTVRYFIKETDGRNIKLLVWLEWEG